MLSRCRRAASHLCNIGLTEKRVASSGELYSFHRSFSKVYAAAVAPSSPPSSPPKSHNPKPEARLNALFWSKPCSLALAPNSPLRIEEPQYDGIRRIVLKLMLFYSKQSKSIRGANVVYKRIITQDCRLAPQAVQTVATTIPTFDTPKTGEWKKFLPYSLETEFVLIKPNQSSKREAVSGGRRGSFMEFFANLLD